MVMGTINKNKNFILLKSFSPPWNWLAVITGRSSVYFQWHVKLNLRHKQWFAYIHTPLIGFQKNNASWAIRLCCGKYFVELMYHW